MPFKTIGLSDPLVQGILATGYSAPTEIQAQAIPAAIEGKDIIGCAQTGTGKTAAFVLPILHRLSHEDAPKAKKKSPRALILTPTRELAVQIENAIENYSRFLKLRVLSVYGGVSIHIQLRHLKKGVDIIVATPGRLMDHMNRDSIRLNNVEMLVLDEADRMCDMGFINDVRKIVSAMPVNRQNMLFSATMSDDVKRLTSDMMKSPVVIQIGEERNPIDTITQHIYPVSSKRKMELLLHVLEKENMFSVLIFSRTKVGADRIARRLEKAGIKSIAIHSDRSQAQRQRGLNGFKAGKYRVMVATDIAARGIDIRGLSHVINFDVPTYAEDYIHRIGRTGRAEAKGDAITFVCRDEEMHLRKIERFIDMRFELEQAEGFEYTDADLIFQSKGDGKKTKSGGNRRGGKRGGGKFGSNRDKSASNSNKSTRNKKYSSGKKTTQRSESKGEKSSTDGDKRSGGKKYAPGSKSGEKKFSPGKKKFVSKKKKTFKKKRTED